MPSRIRDEEDQTCAALLTCRCKKSQRGRLVAPRDKNENGHLSANGMRVNRTIELDDRAAELRIASER